MGECSVLSERRIRYSIHYSVHKYQTKHILRVIALCGCLCGREINFSIAWCSVCMCTSNKND